MDRTHDSSAVILNFTSAKYYYTKDTWDVDSWIDVISIEYKQLIEKIRFDEKLRPFAEKGIINLLDIGCGTAIFPTYLDKELSGNIHLCCDLLDISHSSLRQARRALNKLDHFSVCRLYQSLIEDIPTTLAGNEGYYDVIWAIHSFTTVDVARMADVYMHLIDLLAPGGCIFIYQLTARSSYRKLHNFYLTHHTHGKDGAPFMEYEDTKRILDSLGAKYEVHELFFHHEIDDRRSDLLEKYLRKCILDDSVDVLEFFESVLEEFHDSNSHTYRIPQFVNFVEVTR